MAARWGLSGKSAATLLLACLLSLIPVAIIGWLAIDEVRRYFATAYAEQYTLLQMQRIMTPVSRELALSRRFADSVVTREWLRAPNDPERRARFLEEAEGFRQQFGSNAYSLIDASSNDYYFGDAPRHDLSPRYRLSDDDPADEWYFDTLSSTSTYDISVKADQALQRAMIWVNVKVRDGGEVLGLAGGGIDLERFLDRFIRASAPGITPMVVDARGALQAHPDQARIALGAVRNPFEADNERHIQSLVGEAHRAEVRQALQDAMRRPGALVDLEVELEGQPRLLTVGFIPELQWLLVTALDMRAAPLLDSRWFWPLALALGLILATLMAGFAYATHRLILTPLHRLKLSAQAIAAGHYATRLPTERQDEIGELSRAFSRMAGRVERHTQELEGKVRERTRDLEQANAEMAAAHQQISDSLQYASIIQRAILPDRQLDLHLEHAHGVLWKPRDTVGGDIYVFRATERGYLMGVIDCAGHGVPGSLMTMLARAIIDHAILRLGTEDPAALLIETDRQSRDMLRPDQLPASIATNMDIGLVWVDLQAQRLTFAGAKIGLYATDGHTLDHLPGHRRALGHRRPVTYRNQSAPLRLGWTYSLCTDGFLDQAGGDDGFGFGNRRFEAMLKAQAQHPIAMQITAFEAELRAYQGDRAQRDDITLLGFRFTRDTEAPRRKPAQDTPQQPPTASPAGTGLPS